MRKLLNWLQDYSSFEYVSDICVFFVVFELFCDIWKSYEIAQYGFSQASEFDAIIAILISLTITALISRLRRNEVIEAHKKHKKHEQSEMIQIHIQENNMDEENWFETAKATAAEQANLTVNACKILADKHHIEPYWFMQWVKMEFEKLVKEYE